MEIYFRSRIRSHCCRFFYTSNKKIKREKPNYVAMTSHDEASPNQFVSAPTATVGLITRSLGPHKAGACPS